MTMKVFSKSLKIVGLIAVVTAAAGAPALAAPRQQFEHSYQTADTFRDRDRMPEARFERQPPMPRRDAVWHKGHWRFDRGQWKWTAGMWLAR
jgi:hypothetical protein